MQVTALPKAMKVAPPTSSGTRHLSQSVSRELHKWSDAIANPQIAMENRQSSTATNNGRLLSSTQDRPGWNVFNFYCSCILSKFKIIISIWNGHSFFQLSLRDWTLRWRQLDPTRDGQKSARICCRSHSSHTMASSFKIVYKASRLIKLNFWSKSVKTLVLKWIRYNEIIYCSMMECLQNLKKQRCDFGIALRTKDRVLLSGAIAFKCSD